MLELDEAATMVLELVLGVRRWKGCHGCVFLSLGKKKIGRGGGWFRFLGFGFLFFVLFCVGPKMKK